MKYFTTALLLWATLLLVSCKNDAQPITLTLSPSGTDDTAPLQELLEEARTKNQKGHPIVLQLTAGDYHIYSQALPQYEVYISNHDYLPLRPVAFMLEGLSNVKVEGEGARLLFHGRVIPFVVKDSEAVTLEGFSIDYPRPALSQVEVLEVEGTNVKVQLPAETEFRIEEENRFVLLGEGFEQRLFMTMPFSANRHMKWQRAEVAFNPLRITPLGNQQLLLEGWPEAPHLAVGDRYILRSYHRPTPGIFIIDSKDVEVHNVTVHYAEGMALVAQNTADITLDGFKVLVPEGSERYFTTQADATHFSGCRGQLLSTNGVYEHMADDAINVHGTYLRVDTLLSGTQLVASFAHPQSFGFRWYEEGDTLRLVNRRSLLSVTGSLVGATVEPLNEKELRITFAEPLPEEVMGLSLAVENLSAHPSVRFTESLVRNNRARGALFSTPKPVLCEHNTFDHVHGSAILLCGDANGWYESGPCEDITIRGNLFINALTAKYQFTDGVISISPEIPELSLTEQYHGRVVVEGNRFVQFATPLIYAKSVRQLVLRDNKVERNQAFPSLFTEYHSVYKSVGTVEGELEY